jgi:predicted enzyme related to lactoylglutathione lyase
MIASHFRLLVGDFEQTFRFYREVVGLPTTYPADAAGPYAEFELGGDKYLGLFDRGLMLDAVGRSPSSERSQDDHTVLCISVDDVDAEARRLQELGVELAAPWPTTSRGDAHGARPRSRREPRRVLRAARYGQLKFARSQRSRSAITGPSSGRRGSATMNDA